MIAVVAALFSGGSLPIGPDIRHAAARRSMKWPFNGKNRAARARLTAGFMAMH